MKYILSSFHLSKKNAGIECVNKFYIKSFFNNQIDGQQLLKISYSELIELVNYK